MASHDAQNIWKRVCCVWLPTACTDGSGRAAYKYKCSVSWAYAVRGGRHGCDLDQVCLVAN